MGMSEQPGTALAALLRELAPTVAQYGLSAALPGPPGAIAGIVAGKATGRILDELMAVQTSQEAELARLNVELAGRLLNIELGVNRLLDAPLEDGRALVRLALRAPSQERRARDMLSARDAFLRAWSRAR